jgi:hypothetical protein
MPQRTTQPTTAGKRLAWPLTWIRAGCTIAGRRLYAAPDATAARHGWQVTATHWGLGRVYRDPRYSRRAEGSSASLPGDQP